MGSQSTLLLALPSAPPQLWECQQSALVSLRDCFHKATSADPLKSGPRTTVVMHLELLLELWRQLRPWLVPAPCMHMPTKPTAAKGRPIPAAGAPIVCLDVPQVLNSQSQWQRCKSVAHAAMGKDFSPVSQVTRPLGLSCGLSPASAHGQPAGVCSQSPPR